MFVHEVQIYDVINDDFRSKTTRKQHRCLLNALIKYLKLLWEEGIDVDDAYMGDNFKLCAMLFCIINDFLTYSNLSGYKSRYIKCILYENLVHTNTNYKMKKKLFNLDIKIF